MSRAYLLDANVVIALVVGDHEHHERVARWIDGREIALCPVVEGALVRFLVRAGDAVETAVSLLSALRDHPRCKLWPDDLSYVDVDLSRVIGHRQVTDAYLAGLAARHGVLLATLDEPLANAYPDATELIE